MFCCPAGGYPRQGLFLATDFTDLTKVSHSPRSKITQSQCHWGGWTIRLTAVPRRYARGSGVRFSGTKGNLDEQLSSVPEQRGSAPVVGGTVDASTEGARHEHD